MLNVEQQYIQLLKRVQQAPLTTTRNGMTRSLFGYQLEITELPLAFPILQGRKMYWKGVLGEMVAFLRGPQSNEDFTKQGCNFWTPWEDSNGCITVDYGNAWLDFNGVNQLARVVDSLLYEPHSRRHLITGWNPARLDELSLPCCHYAYQWKVTALHQLDMIWIQRSADVFLGLPSDIISAAIFNLLMANTTGYIPGRIIMQLGDVHLYSGHFNQAEQYLTQAAELTNSLLNVPKYSLAPSASVFSFTKEDFAVFDYQHQSPIQAPICV
jgi:thymidylate synthase